MNKSQFLKILFLVIFWIFAVTYIITYEAIALGFSAPFDLAAKGMEYDFKTNLIIGISFTLVIGFIMAWFDVLYLSKYLRKKPFGLTLLIKTIFYISNIFVWSSIAVWVMYANQLSLSLFSGRVLDLFLNYLSSARLFITLTYWCIIIFISLFTLEVSDKFGPGVLLNFLLGKYHSPKEEVRIFMFMDLKSSTTFAEKLGHIKYSQLIQDCFYDVTEVVNKYGAQIYQYVGDEVVLSWEISYKDAYKNSIITFFEYSKLLKRKEKYYDNKYGLTPEFKAGINSGKVTVAEVGELKKELAYHGDVLNTAARIQGKCNEFKKSILISENIKVEAEKEAGYIFNFVDSVILRGKEKSIKIYDVVI